MCQTFKCAFFLEEAYQTNKPSYLPNVDFLDIVPRRESVPAARGQPLMLQLQVQPAYNLTNHKVQALTIRHQVDGCLEGVFAHGQVHVEIMCCYTFYRCSEHFL